MRETFYVYICHFLLLFYCVISERMTREGKDTEALQKRFESARIDYVNRNTVFMLISTSGIQKISCHLQAKKNLRFI